MCPVLHCVIEWYWKLWIRQWVYRVGAILLALLSILIVWCEITFWAQFGDIRLSIFAELVYVLHDYGNYIAVEVSNKGGQSLEEICTIAHLLVCTYYFGVQFFTYY